MSPMMTYVGVCKQRRQIQSLIRSANHQCESKLGMNSATFKIIRQFLGITADEVAKACGVTLRSARRWESTHTPPDDAVQWLQSKWHEMDSKVASIIQDINATEADAGEKHIHLTAYRTDDSAEGALPSGTTKEQHAAILGAVQFLTMHDDKVHITIDFADIGE